MLLECVFCFFIGENYLTLPYNVLYFTQDVHNTNIVKVIFKKFISGLQFVSQIILETPTVSQLSNATRSSFVNAVHETQAVLQYHFQNFVNASLLNSKCLIIPMMRSRKRYYLKAQI